MTILGDCARCPPRPAAKTASGSQFAGAHEMPERRPPPCGVGRKRRLLSVCYADCIPQGLRKFTPVEWWRQPSSASTLLCENGYLYGRFNGASR
jgi:hypothetical protein